MSRRERYTRAIQDAFPYTIPVFIGFIVLGTAYGVLMSSKGYAPIFSILMSMIAFCGSMQYVSITLLVSTFQPFYALFLSFLVNARHLFYGLSMLEKYKGIKKVKPFLIFALCDETFSVVCNANPKEGTDKTLFYLFISLFNYLYWAIGTAIGAFIGSFIKFDTNGLDFALTALFVVIFVEQWKSMKNHIPALIGIVCSVLALVVVGQTFFILVAMILILLIMIVFRNQIEDRTRKEVSDDGYNIERYDGE